MYTDRFYSSIMAVDYKWGGRKQFVFMTWAFYFSVINLAVCMICLLFVCVYLPVLCVCVCLSVYPCFCLCWSVSLCTVLRVCLSVCVAVSICMCVSLCSVCLSNCVSVLFVCVVCLPDSASVSVCQRQTFDFSNSSVALVCSWCIGEVTFGVYIRVHIVIFAGY